MACPTEQAFRQELAKVSVDLSHMAASLLGGLLAEAPLRRRLPARWSRAARDAASGAAFGAGAGLGGQLADRRQSDRPLSLRDVGSASLFAGAATPLINRFLR